LAVPAPLSVLRKIIAARASPIPEVGVGTSQGPWQGWEKSERLTLERATANTLVGVLARLVDQLDKENRRLKRDPWNNRCGAQHAVLAGIGRAQRASH
jgi:hypothetical protein